MTPRLPLVAAALAATALAFPASAVTVEAGAWTSGSGVYFDGLGGVDGEVTWANTTTSWCSGSHWGGDGHLSCTGAVTFDAECTGHGVWGTLVTFECVDTARNVYVQADVALLGPSRGIAGTITYQRL